MAKIPFNVKFRPQIESGEYKVISCFGEKAEIVFWDGMGELPILVVVWDGDTIDSFWCDSEGKNATGKESLFLITPEEDLTEFEKAVADLLRDWTGIKPEIEPETKTLKEDSAKLLAIAREQFIKDGYVIEKKDFHDAVEKIDDKFKTEMLVQYSIYCKVKNGTQHAVMNWEEFQKLAQRFIELGKTETLKTVLNDEDMIAMLQLEYEKGRADVLKDLPKWDSDLRTSMVNFPNVIGTWLYYKEHRIKLNDLEKLPGFKKS